MLQRCYLEQELKTDICSYLFEPLNEAKNVEIRWVGLLHVGVIDSIVDIDTSVTLGLRPEADKIAARLIRMPHTTRNPSHIFLFPFILVPRLLASIRLNVI
jgi:hypothetical protein